MDFEFKTFSTRSFERFAQAMALHALGNGVLIFGDGPDGGREATYEGQLDYPSDQEKWSGYTIMQAKFLQVPGTPREDADWLVKQLRAELSKFADSESKLKKPDYYILVSNAKLSSVPANDRVKGGIAKIDEVFEEHKDILGIKDYQVWHLDKLSTMLLNADSIRRTYSAWLSSSDVIADILSNMKEGSRSVQDAMYRYLMRELRSHQPIRLQQAGHSGNSQTMIEDVFTDLPFHISQTRKDKNKANQLLLESLLDRSRDCLDGASIIAQQDGEDGRPERILLMGGPGQGKSTLSQYLAQIFRASMLHSNRKGKYPAEIGSIIESTLHKASESGLAVNIPRRFPLRVDLPNFADWLSKVGIGNAASLLSYIAQHITNVSASPVTINDLRHWISDYPSIIIIDGLDEVPSSANRGSVIQAINEFWDETTNADLLMIVTTRPQGYNDDLDPNYYSKIEMTPLDPEQALSYAKKLAGALITDPLQFERVISRLSEAAESQTTARLLVSPLQVAILLSLIDQRGDAPTDRWSLFDKYFAVMLQREQGKAGPVGQTMRHWSRQISAIHYKAGFLLHVEAEIKGNSETNLSLSDLEGLIRGQLQDEDFESTELEKSTSALLEVSTERLVLLVQREEGKFSFEVRSLQEFMAAAYLMTGREAVVQRRLRTISNREHWLHVFQITASKCFSINDAEHYRDTIIAICSELNDGDEEIDKFLRTGSKLALALLDDGLAYDQPKYRRLLFNIALGLLHRGPALLPTSLADHCHQEAARTIAQLRNYLASIDTATADSAWKLIFYCAAKGQDWLESIVNEFWPTSQKDIARLLTVSYGLPLGSPLHERLQHALADTSLSEVKKAVDYNDNSHLSQQLKRIKNRYPVLNLIRPSRQESLSIKLKVREMETPLSFKLKSIKIDKETSGAYENIPQNENWAPQLALKKFHENPNRNSLADTISEIKSQEWSQEFINMFYALPWPCATLFILSHEQQDHENFVNQIRSGSYGDFDDWKNAEDRWTTEGASEIDLEKLSKGIFFDLDIATSGIPIPRPAISYIHSTPEPPNGLMNILKPYALASTGEQRTTFRIIIDFLLSVNSSYKEADIDIAYLLLEEDSASIQKDMIDPRILESLPVEFLENPNLLRHIDRAGQAGEVYLLNNTGANSTLISKLIGKEKVYPGIIVFIANLAASYQSVSLKTLSDIDLEFIDKNCSPVISQYANILKFIRGEVNEQKISEIMITNEKTSSFLPYALLVQFLEDQRLERSTGLRIAEAIAAVANREQSLNKSSVSMQIQSLASGRLSELHKQECWVDLEFGESLLALSLKRRKSLASV